MGTTPKIPNSSTTYITLAPFYSNVMLYLVWTFIDRRGLQVTIPANSIEHHGVYTDLKFATLMLQDLKYLLIHLLATANPTICIDSIIRINAVSRISSVICINPHCLYQFHQFYQFCHLYQLHHLYQSHLLYDLIDSVDFIIYINSILYIARIICMDYC